MDRLRTRLLRSPGLSALTAMIAAVAIAWGAPIVGTSSAPSARSVPLA